MRICALREPHERAKLLLPRKSHHILVVVAVELLSAPRQTLTLAREPSRASEREREAPILSSDADLRRQGSIIAAVVAAGAASAVADAALKLVEKSPRGIRTPNAEGKRQRQSWLQRLRLLASCCCRGPTTGA